MPLVNKSQEFHLYHATKPPLVVYGEAAKSAATVDSNGKATGYGTEFIPQDYPKWITLGERQILVQSAEEEAAAILASAPTQPADNVDLNER